MCLNPFGKKINKRCPLYLLHPPMTNQRKTFSHSQNLHAGLSFGCCTYKCNMSSVILLCIRIASFLIYYAGSCWEPRPPHLQFFYLFWITECQKVQHHLPWHFQSSNTQDVIKLRVHASVEFRKHSIFKLFSFHRKYTTWMNYLSQNERKGSRSEATKLCGFDKIKFFAWFFQWYFAIHF